MREIKFRGVVTEEENVFFINGEWAYGNLLIDDNGLPWINKSWTPSIEVPTVAIVDPETVGQFTGLHDKECNEIYEGDIIEFIGEETGYFKLAIGFYEGGFVTEDGQFDLDLDLAAECLVIGNEHDNPNTERTLPSC